MRFDIASALPYGEHEGRLRFAMKVGGSYGIYPSADPTVGLARDVGVDRDALAARLLALATGAPDAFRAAAAEPAVRSLGGATADTLAALAADRCRRCARLVGG